MAINAFKQATDLNKDLGEAHFKLGVAYSLEEDAEDLPPGVEGNSDKAFRNAVTIYKKYLKDNPDDAAAYFNLGRAHGKLFEDKEAADAIGKAVKLDDENALYKTEYGAALIKLARYGEAIKQLEKALEMEPEDLYAEDLLEKAQAGKKRVDFRPPDKSGSNSNANANANDSEDKGTASNTSRPAGPAQSGKSVPPPQPPPPVKAPPPSPK
jgi:tetratricopeptide (TPR) repeat protein